MAVSRLHGRELIQRSPQGVDHNAFGHHHVFFELGLGRQMASSVNLVFLGMLQNHACVSFLFHDNNGPVRIKELKISPSSLAPKDSNM